MDAQRDDYLLRKNILLETVGKEVQDAATLAIETLRQMTPTSLFPPSVSREQLSPCTLPIPITSILGLFSTMRHLQYISRNMQRLSRVMFTEYVEGIVEKTSPHYHRGENGFDVGEFVQSLGDLVSADAALRGVEFGIYHSEYGLSHVPIKGSEESWRHALINVSLSFVLHTHRYIYVPPVGMSINVSFCTPFNLDSSLRASLILPSLVRQSSFV
jgi:hypothetical protein